MYELSRELNFPFIKFVRSICIAIISTIKIVGTYATAYADAVGHDWKGYAGVNCLPSSDSATYRRSVSGVSTAFSNSGSSAMSVYCPVVRDEAAGGNNRVLAVSVLLRNRHSTSDVRCEFSSHAIDGVKFDSDTAICPSNGSDNTCTLSMGPINTSNWGSYALTCSLPGRNPVTNLQSYIVNYRVDEIPQ